MSAVLGNRAEGLVSNMKLVGDPRHIPEIPTKVARKLLDQPETTTDYVELGA